jgi:hypothetical protein
MTKLSPAALTALLLAVTASAQPPRPAEIGPPVAPAPPFLRAEPWPPLPAPEPPEAPAPAAGPAPGLAFLPRFSAAVLPRFADRGLGVLDLDAAVKARIPTGGDLPPLEVAPAVAVHFLDGPAAFLPDARPAAHARLYDLAAVLGWRPRPAAWLFIDLEVTPDLATDFHNLSRQAFRPRGQALGIVAFSEQFQLVAGLLYVNRLSAKVIPAGGFRYAPSEDVEYRIVFPAPRASWRVFDAGGQKYHLFVEGEFGGGSWAVRRPDGADDVLGYSDVRALGGLEAEAPNGRRWRVEAGYVFGRRLQFASGVPGTLRPTPTVLLRAGVEF